MGSKWVPLLPRWADAEQTPDRHRWSWWPTPFGEMFVDQQLGLRARSGSTRLTGPVEATIAVAAAMDGYGRYLRDGVALTIASAEGRLVRDGYGLRAASRQMQVEVADRRWTVEASWRRMELRRDGQLVAVDGGNVPGTSKLTGDAQLDDAVLAVLLSVNGLWDGAALWARYLARTGEG